MPPPPAPGQTPPWDASEPEGQYPSTGDFEPLELPQPWPGARQGQFPPGQFPPGTQYRPAGQGLLGRLPFSPSPVVIAVAVTMAVGILLVVLGAHSLS